MQQHLRLLLLLSTVLISYNGMSQKNTTLLNGIVKSAENDVSNVLIVNLNSKESTITDSSGLFTIEVRLRDSLRIMAVQYLKKEIVITDSIFNENFVAINLIENIINLNEVTVTPYNLTGRIDQDLDRLNIKPAVTSSSLKLPNADLELMTHSERLLIEADRGKYVSYYVIALKINLHKTLNRFSGRTKSLEDMVARDEKMAIEKQIITKFSKKTLSENFDIPETNIDGFLTFCLSQEDFSELSNTWNTTEVRDYLKAKSIEFKRTDLITE
ncbi:carboxypeptidase-like regulatory domain-containing protein [Zobellia barbeyronii]|nr:carboxypeptidase-like regulatory domain-containing protein [Zobellia barbeyronii]